MKKTLISLKEVNLWFSSLLVLDNISLDIYEDQILTLIGPNGAGKTSLIKVLLKLIKPNSGLIRYSKNLSIGYVPQRFYVDKNIPLTVKGFLEIRNVNFSVNKIKYILNDVGIANHMHNMYLSELSGGQLQRVLLARALLKNPSLLVLDEPMQGVDLNGQQELYELLSTVKNNYKCAIVLVSHDLNFVMSKTDLVVCLNKHICCYGKPAHVSNSLEYKRIFDSNVSLYSHKHDHTHLVDGSIN